MNKTKLLSLLLAVLMAIAVLPVASLAEDLGYRAHESYMLGLCDEAWAKLEAVEAEALANGATPEEVTMAVYRAALNCDLVDENSITDLEAQKFFFRVNGMLCGFNYVSRSASRKVSLDIETAETVSEVIGTRNGAASTTVLLIGPYYGYDSSFTNQYREEAQSLSDYTVGELVKLEGHAATGPAIAAAIVNAGTVIYDSHGTAGNNTSYLCLTTNAGITSTDTSNGWAYNGGSSDAGIDGRYIQNHIEGELKNCFIWMAICEGMKKSGKGTTGTALLAAGAGVVYGYSQSVTFTGDYKYEATFWTEMKNGATVEEAITVMKNTWGVPDPYGDAYPIVMSPDDPFPANPDAPQTVHSDWRLYRESDMVVTDPVSLSFESTEVGIAPTFTKKLIPVIEPLDANNYTSEWTSSDESIVTVSNKGVLTGIRNGMADVTLTISSTENSNTVYTYSATVHVTVSNAYLPEEVMYVPTDIIVPGETYLIGCALGGRNYVISNEYYSTANSRNLKTTSVLLSTVDNVTCIIDGVTAANEWVFSAGNGGFIQNVETGSYLAVGGNYLVLADEGTDWAWEATDNSGTGVLSNDVSSYYHYLGINTSGSYFGLFMQPANIQLYRKLSREAVEPIAGDVNGDGNVNANDALMLMRYALGLVELTPAQLAVADINGDDRVDANDALMLMRKSLGLI